MMTENIRQAKTEEDELSEKNKLRKNKSKRDREREDWWGGRDKTDTGRNEIL